jgi:hypothetical protein
LPRLPTLHRITTSPSGLIWTITSIALAACGGGGGGGGSTGISVTGLFVRVVDGPVHEAIVYFDINDDGRIPQSERDDPRNRDIHGEVYMTDENGIVEIHPDYPEYVNRLFVAVVTGATDTSTMATLKGEFWSLGRGGVSTPLTDLINLAGENRAQDVLNQIFDIERQITINDILNIQNYQILENSHDNPKAYLITQAALALTEIDKQDISEGLPTKTTNQDKTQERINLLEKIIDEDSTSSEVMQVLGLVTVRVVAGHNIQRGPDLRLDANDNRPNIYILGTQRQLNEGKLTTGTDTGFRITASDLDDPNVVPVIDIKNSDGFHFTIDNDGKLLVAQDLTVNYEDQLKRNITLTITAEDTGGGGQGSPGNSDETIVIHISNINDNLPKININGKPNALNEQTFSSATNTGYTYRVSDADGGTPRLTVTGDSKNRFEAVGGQLRIIRGAVFDYEDPSDRTFMLKIRATDDETGGISIYSTRHTDSSEVTITFKNSNDNLPEIVISGSSNTLLEKTFTSATNTGYTYTISDADGGTPTLSVMGDSENRFEAVDGHLRIVAGASFDYEDPNDRAISLSIRASDDTTGGRARSPGYTDSQKVSVTIGNQNDNLPVIDVDGTLSTLIEQRFTSATNTGYTYSIADADGGTPTLAVLGDSRNRFEAVGGHLRIVDGSRFDYEDPTDQSFSLTIRASDDTTGGNALNPGYTDSQTVTVTIGNRDEGDANFRLTSDGDLNTPEIGDVLTVGFDPDAANGGRDPDLSTEAGTTFTYQWYHIGTGINGANVDITGATGDKYTLKVADAGLHVGVRVSYSENSVQTVGTTPTVRETVSAELQNSVPIEVKIYEGHPSYRPIELPIVNLARYQLTDGYDDNALFRINNGKLWWIAVPDFEDPKDGSGSSKDNRYEIELSGTKNGQTHEIRAEIIVQDIEIDVDLNYYLNNGDIYFPTLNFTPKSIPDVNKPDAFTQHLFDGTAYKLPKIGPLLITYSIPQEEQRGLKENAFSNNQAMLDNFYVRLRSLLNQFEDAANIKFIEIEHGAEELHNTGNSELENLVPNIVLYFRSGDLASTTNTAYGATITFGYNTVHSNPTILHEFGHALRLKHPFEFTMPSMNPTTFDPEQHWPRNESYEFDSRSIISYSSGVQKLQPADIRALQFLYGAPNSDNSGVKSILVDVRFLNETVSFNSSTRTGFRYRTTDDENNLLALSVTGDTQNRFEIDANGNLLYRAGFAVDYETSSDREITLIITGTDSNGVQKYSEKAIFVINNINDNAPVIMQTDSSQDPLTAGVFNVATDTGYVFSITDADGGTPVVTVSDTRFEVDGSGNLRIIAGQTIDYSSLNNGVLELTITATDDSTGAGSTPDPVTSPTIRVTFTEGAMPAPPKKPDDDHTQVLQSQVTYELDFSVNEGEILIANLSVLKLSNPTLSGHDQGDVQIRETQNGSVLEFILPPDFEVREDHNQDNVYEFTVFDDLISIDVDVTIVDL